MSTDETGKEPQPRSCMPTLGAVIGFVLLIVGVQAMHGFDGHDFLEARKEVNEAKAIEALSGALPPSGSNHGYLFDHVAAVDSGKWSATANPTLPTTTGDRYFSSNHAGVVFWTTSSPFPLDPNRDDTIPAGAVRVRDPR